MKRNLITLLTAGIFCLLSTTLYSQEPKTTNKKAAKLYMDARILMHQRKFDEAAQLLQEAIHKDTSFVQAHLELGSIYRLLLQHIKAKEQYFKAVMLDPNNKDMASAYFVAGEYLFNDGKYVQAESYFKKVIQYNPPQKGLVEKTTKYLKNCAFAIEGLKSPMTYHPQLMPDVINRFYIQAFPVLTTDAQSLIYSIRRGVKPSDDEDIVISHLQSRMWSPPESLSPNINTKYNEGVCSISGDGRILVFTSCDRSEKTFLGRCDLYIAYKEGEDWSIPINMGENVNTANWESQPSISADGKTIYFSSDRPGGMGLGDIWVTKLNEKGEWSRAKNMGAIINTRGSETSPFIHANGTSLFFSSDTHPGFGGFDIFSTSLKDSLPTTPVNVGYPLNSQLNDISIFVTADGKKGYYSVDQRDENSLMFTRSLLYEFDCPPEILKIVKKNTYAKGTIYDAVTKKPIGAAVDLIDLATGKTLQSVSADVKNGKYIVVLTDGNEYGLYVGRQGYLFKSLSFDYRQADKFDPTFLDIYLDPVKAGAGVVLNNLFFGSNSYTIDPKSKTELNQIISFLKKYPTVKIEFGGYTDNVGSESDNIVLSEKRAKSVYDFMVTSGIPASRLKFKGYGESNPIATNETEAGRIQNRRIEFKIL